VESPRSTDLDVLATRRQIRRVVGRLGAELSSAHGDGVVLVGVLKGSVVFLADLVRALSVAPVVDFLAVQPYEPDSGRIRLVKDLEIDVARRVVLVEDLVDTGLTSTWLLEELGRRGADRVSLCTLLDKRVRRLIPVAIDHVGFEAPDRFVLGYGMDFAGRYRNLPFLATAPAMSLAADPDRYLDDLYGRYGSG
jgi:hypoxanthine phosphoribosyltransferase